MNNNFTFLTVKQIDGDNQLDIIKKYGAECSITDFAILLGGFVNDNHYTLYRKTLENRTGCWWTKSANGYNDVYSIGSVGEMMEEQTNQRSIGARPALSLSHSTIPSSREANNEFGIKEIMYGEYPQMIVKKSYAKELERAFIFGNIKKTGRFYTTDSVFTSYYGTSFQPIRHTEYEYQGNKYIRLVSDWNGLYEKLSDDRVIMPKKPYWIQVEPIKWLVDEKTNIALSKKILFAGVQFQNTRNYQGDFNNTDIKKFMNKYFSKEIITNKYYSQTTTIELEEKKPIRKQNPYNFIFDDVEEEDIIRGSIESNIPVFLHGKSSEGKSARVKQLDPDCEIIYMRNATPDSLNGKSVYNALTGEMIDVPPTWYTRVLEKCNKEPNKIHLVFFDELTNALPSIQGMAFNIVLDKEVNGKWMLPENARIVAAGNDLDDSLAANQMAEPLFNRFAHVYIHTTVNNWLKWASTPKDKYKRLDYIKEKEEEIIHPSIFSYIAYKSYNGNNVLRTPYTGEKPNADPRKWEMASKVLYKTKKPEMLRALIGEELTRDFTAFTKQQVISVEDVINHNYSDIDLEMDISQKFATAVGLSSVDEEHFETVREFMKQIGSEPRAAFESMWTHGDEKRLEKLAEIKINDNLSQGKKLIKNNVW